MSIAAHALGALAVLALSTLPGVALVSARSAKTPLEWLGLVCAVSLGVNCFGLMLLNALGIYRPSTAAAWLAALIASTAGLLLRARSGVAPRTSDAAATPAGARGARREALQDLVALPIVAIVACKTWFFPLSSWDAVASWNRWARNYLLVPDYFHSERFFYPQYHSWAMSFPYMLMRDPVPDEYAHALSFAYLLVLYAGVVHLSRALRAPAWVAFPLLFVTLPIASWVGSGYADDAATAFAALAVALFLEVCDPTTGAFRSNDIAARRGAARALLSGLAAGTAFLFKPSSAAVTLAVPAVATLVLREPHRSRRLALAAVVAAGALLVAAPWLASPQTSLADPQLAWVLQRIHGDLSPAEVLHRGLKTLLEGATILASTQADSLFLAAGALFLLAGMARDRRALCVGVVASADLALWVNTANYDTRALLPALPLFVVVAVRGLCDVSLRVIGSRFGRVPVALVAAASLALFVASELTPPGCQGETRLDPRPGAGWSASPLLAERQEKLARLSPAIAALILWKEQHPGFGGLLWTDALLSAAYDPTRPSGGGSWIGVLLDASRRPRWGHGDAVLVSSFTLGQRPFVFDAPTGYRGAMPDDTWAQWLAREEHAGRVRRSGQWGDYAGYEVLLDH